MWKTIKKIFFGIILVVLIIVIIILMRRLNVYNRLEKISKEETNRNNFYVEINASYNGEKLSKVETLYKDKKYLTKGDLANDKKVICYVDNNEIIEILQTKEYKSIRLNKEPFFEQPDVKNFYTYVLKYINKYKMAILLEIKEEIYNGKECYLIEIEKNWKVWAEKDTGLVLKEDNNGYIVEYAYKFNTVKDEDIVKPDISDGIIEE